LTWKFEFSGHQQQTQRALLDWLRVEYGIENPATSAKRKAETLKGFGLGPADSLRQAAMNSAELGKHPLVVTNLHRAGQRQRKPLIGVGPPECHV
jgi:hypothetical protein